MSAKHEWLNLLEVSGPFLAVPVLREVFPQGLEELETSPAKRLRSAYEEWRDAVDADDPDLERVHAAWIDEVLRTALEADDHLLKRGKAVPSSAFVELPEHDANIEPEIVFVDPTHGDVLLAPIHVFPPDTDLSASMKFGGLSCSPGDRMALHLRALNKPFGLVTNGERWMLVHAPSGQVATFASWYARMWGQEPQTLRAFTSLLGIRRFFAPEHDRIPALFERSRKHQDEVTDALGDQVRRAIEVLVQALDRADQDRNRELLRDVTPQELYEAGLTVMMRLVFLLAAEERGLLLLGEPRYDSFYAVSTLRMQLRAESDEILERRRAAWSRLLAVFRAVFGGIDHPTLRLPAMGGSLFDPDRFPFLEGRLKSMSWRQHRAEPLPIDDRTVLLLLEAIQTFEGRTLSYRALDVEQIGHVYEGLLERTVARVEDVTLELEAGVQAKDARVTLGELESQRLDGQGAATNLLVERSKRSESAIKNALAAEVEPQHSARLLSACRGDVKLRDRLKPYVRLMRTDPWGSPLVHPKGAFVVVLGADRRETGTHYTPKSLTERIVEETLTPLVYEGPAKGTSRGEWKLKTPEQLLDLKVCDPAMGSGAFLVQACRFLSARLVESWAIEETAGRVVDLTGQVHEPRTSVESMPPGAEGRAEDARRIVAERCLYGVDLNPLAVELAKLSLWLVTLSKGRPFGFLDHNLRRGDSLLGINRLEQLTELTITPGAQLQGRLFGKSVRQAVAEAVKIRLQLREMPVRDIRDVQAMASLDVEARGKLELAGQLADAFVATVLAARNPRALESKAALLASEADSAVRGTPETLAGLRRRNDVELAVDSPTGRARRPLHWPLEFPEVFDLANGGFHAVIGNPPFLGGKKISTVLGERYRNAIVALTARNKKGAADLCAYFLLRAHQLLRRPLGAAGLLSTDSICDGDNAAIGLRGLDAEGAHLVSAVTSMPWPGEAGVSIAILCWVASDADWHGRHVLDGRDVARIQWDLTTTSEAPAREIHALKSRVVDSFAGSYINGEGFLLTPDEARALIAREPKNRGVVKPYFTGADVNTEPRQQPTRWVIDFGTMSRASAEQYSECFDIVTKRVKPYRDTLTKQVHESDYWKFWDKRLSSYARIVKYKRVLVAARAAKDVQLTWVKNEGVFSDQLVVFITECSGIFACLQSTVHNIWAWDVCTGMWGSGIRYAPSKAVSTYPLPSKPETLRDIGDRYYQARLDYEYKNNVGLTDLYNRFHDPTNAEPGISRLRTLHEEMDRLVLVSYGWHDIAVRYAFDVMPSGPRRVLVPEVREAVLSRLVKLNNEIHAAASQPQRRSARGESP